MAYQHWYIALAGLAVVEYALVAWLERRLAREGDTKPPHPRSMQRLCLGLVVGVCLGGLFVCVPERSGFSYSLYVAAAFVLDGTLLLLVLLWMMLQLSSPPDMAGPAGWIAVKRLNWAMAFLALQMAGVPLPLWATVVAAVFWLPGFLNDAFMLGMMLSFHAVRGELFGQRAQEPDRVDATGIPLRATPYDGLVAGSDTELFDVFVSYKSKDVAAARLIADQLIASGLKPWFAEYVILLQGRDREQISTSIHGGALHSRYGVALTNDLYAGSDWCRGELDGLLSSVNCGAAGIIEVRLPTEPGPHAVWPCLAAGYSIEWGGDVNEVLTLIGSVAGRPVGPAPVIPTVGEDRRTFFGKGLSCPYSLDVAGWRAEAQYPMTHFGRLLDGHPVTGNLQTGRAGFGQTALTAEQSLDDRRCLEWTARFARGYMSYTRCACTGMHLLFHRGLGHPVLTYWDQLWHRRYSIVLPDPQTGTSLEFAFVFGFDGGFQDYCRYAHVLDAFVCSLQIGAG